jgi:hypothetical protein
MVGYATGDLVLHLATEPHALFERRNVVDLHSNFTVPLVHALVGFTAHLQHVDGRTVTVARNEVTQPGTYRWHSLRCIHALTTTTHTHTHTHTLSLSVSLTVYVYASFSRSSHSIGR